MASENMTQFSTHAKAAFKPAISQAEKDRLSLERILVVDVAPDDETLTSATGDPSRLLPAQPDEADSEPKSVEDAEPTTEPVVLAKSEILSQEQAEPSVTPATPSSSTKRKLSTMKAPARPATTAAYGATVRAALARHQPKAAERGSATVTFKIDASGKLGYARVSSSSGNAAVDQLALQTVRNSAPFPSPPKDAASYTIRIDF
jgi:protein TonB